MSNNYYKEFNDPIFNLQGKKYYEEKHVKKEYSKLTSMIQKEKKMSNDLEKLLTEIFNNKIIRFFYKKKFQKLLEKYRK